MLWTFLLHRSCIFKNAITLQELYKIKTCPKNGKPCTSLSCGSKQYSDVKPLDIKLEDSEFFKVYTIEDLFAIFQQNPKATYILNGGNTAHGNCKKIVFISMIQHISLTITIFYKKYYGKSYIYIWNFYAFLSSLFSATYKDARTWLIIYIMHYRFYFQLKIQMYYLWK